MSGSQGSSDKQAVAAAAEAQDLAPAGPAHRNRWSPCRAGRDYRGGRRCCSALAPAAPLPGRGSLCCPAAALKPPALRLSVLQAGSGASYGAGAGRLWCGAFLRALGGFAWRSVRRSESMDTQDKRAFRVDSRRRRRQRGRPWAAKANRVCAADSKQREHSMHSY